MSIMDQYKSCPRCGGEWKSTSYDDLDNEGLYRCDECYLHRYDPLQLVTWFMSGSIEKPYPRVTWVIAETYCFYRSDFETDRAMLPWLPFNITEDRLKLLLTFS